MNEDNALKARLMKDFEAAIDRMRVSAPTSEANTLVYAEKTAVEVGEKLKEVMVQARLGEHQEQTQEVKCANCGQRLGMKDYRSRQVVTEAGEVGTEAGILLLRGMSAGDFSPWIRHGV